MSTQTIIKCDYCLDQFLSEPVKVQFNGEDLHLCSASCHLKWYARLYHQAMASGATVEVRMKGEKQ